MLLNQKTESAMILFFDLTSVEKNLIGFCKCFTFILTIVSKNI